MKLILVALVATFAIAVVAAVFAIWPVVADAPWEDDAPVVAEDAIDTTSPIRCQEALDLRERLIFENPYDDDDAWRNTMDAARGEIDHYC